MKDIIKGVIVIILAIPLLVVTILIWIFGGWIKGWDNMPNPVNKIFDWLME